MNTQFSTGVSFPFKLYHKPFIAILSFLISYQVSAELPDYSSIVEQISPSIVTIAIVHDEISLTNKPTSDDQGNHFYPIFQLANSSKSPTLLPTSYLSSGTGIVLSQNGFILTNAHVLEGANRIFVITSDGNEFEAETVGLDDFADLAIVKIYAENLIPAKFATNTRQVKAGQVVLGFGSPFGLRNSVTSGIVSHVERSLPGLGLKGEYVSYIQTDLNVNPGNSGGPIVNASGEVIGINSRIMSTTGSSIGLSFGIPIEVINHVTKQLILNGYVTRGWIGVSVENITPYQIQEFLIPSPYGALITTIDDASPAHFSGLKINDVVVTLDNHPIRNKAEFTYHIGLIEEGRSAHISVIRNGRYFATTLAPEQIQLH